jgi:hypothetical protein
VHIALEDFFKEKNQEAGISASKRKEKQQRARTAKCQKTSNSNKVSSKSRGSFIPQENLKSKQQVVEKW